MQKQTLSQTEKRAYVKPEIEVIKVEMESLLGQFSGQHEEATHETVGAPEEGSDTPQW